eukprot:460139-Karenia_brevis.AAC.1
MTPTWRTPIHPRWGKVVEPIIVPKGDQGQPLFNHIYSAHPRIHQLVGGLINFWAWKWQGGGRPRQRHHKPKGLNQ